MVPKPSSSRQADGDMDCASQVAAFGQMLSMTEWLSLEQLQAAQAPLVAKLLLHARRTTSYYKARLDVDLSSAAGVTKFWSTIPVLTRAEAVRNRFKLMSRKNPHDLGPVSEGKT